MRLGLDIGTNSIGWWIYETTGEGPSARIVGVIDGGVRIFSDGRDPKSGTSRAVDRRAARAQRRRRDRYLRRRATLMKVLSQSGLMPENPIEAKKLEVLDPYELRAKGLDTSLSITQLGRALFHINQRRGFKSNRKTDRTDNESGKIKDATKRLDWAMRDEKARTYGEFLHMRRQRAPDPRQVPAVRTRLSIASRGGPDAKEEAGYDFYPDRRHLENEFKILWQAQVQYHPDVLTDKLHDILFEKIFFQRPLKEPEVGLCLFTSDKRIPKAHPLTQRRVLFETVNQLRVTADGRTSRALSIEERDKIIHALDNKKPTKTPTSMNLKLTALGKVIKLKDNERFTLETGVRDAIACDSVRSLMIHPDTFGPGWSTLDWQKQWELIQRVRSVQSDDDFKQVVVWLRDTYGVGEINAQKIASTHFVEGYSRLGFEATQRILSCLQSDVITYSAAVDACGWHHSNERTGECLDILPYYAKVLERHVIPGTYDENDDDITRYGRLTNPTVHIGLNQLRRLVNKIIETYGKPDQIVVELARELKQSKADKDQASKDIRKATAEAERRSNQLKQLGLKNTGENRMLLRLWESLGPAIGPRCCPYTGKAISVTMVFDGSCDVDHILPYSRTLDDSFSNRTLCLKEANRQKCNQTPYEAWGANKDHWATIQANLKNLAENKRWRFSPDAMERFEGENSFLDRAIVDTQYLAKISRSYLDTLFTKGGHVWVVPGRMTEMLRRHWGLNSLLSDKDRGPVKVKNRTDHRHHAIDAAVVAATDRSLVNRISQAAGQGEAAAQSAELIARNTLPPWEDFRADIAAQLKQITVSHRADHGRIDIEGRKTGRDSTAGKLHNDTAYGIIDAQTVVSRTSLLSLKPSDIEQTSKGKNIRDPQLQKALSVATKNKDGKDFEQALVEFSKKEGPYQGLRRLRLSETLKKSSRVEIGETPQGTPLKAYKGDSNHCYEIWRMPDGKYKAHVVTTYNAHQNAPDRPHPAAKRILQVYKRDMVMLEREGETIIGYVQKLSAATGLSIARHNESNADARNRDKNDSFKFIYMSVGTIIKSKLRRVIVDDIGHVRDPGPPKT